MSASALVNCSLTSVRMSTCRLCAAQTSGFTKHTEFAQLYQSAINDRLSVFEEQVIQIADDMRHDFRTVIKNGQERMVADPDMVARAKLRIDVRFRHLKAGRPQKWGDSTTLITKNDDGFDTSNMSAEQLEAEIASIEKKGRIVKVA